MILIKIKYNNKDGLKNLLVANLEICKGDKQTLNQKKNAAPPAGLEPATYGLTVHRSTD